MMSPSPQTPVNPLLLAALSAFASLFIGAAIGVYNPTTGILAAPYLGICALVVIAVRDSGKYNARTERESLIVSAAIICIPLGTIGTLITQ